MDWVHIIFVTFGLICLLLITGLPVAASLGLAGLITGYIFINKVGVLAWLPWNTTNSFVLVAVPLFIFMGQLLLHSKLGKQLYDGTAALLGRFPGGLLHSNIASCAIFAAISGSSVATAMTVGTVAIPELERRGYESRTVIGSIASGGTLGILIPPSIALIIYGAITEESVGSLFMAGVIPGILLASFFMIYVAIISLLRPGTAPPYERLSWIKRFSTIMSAWPVALTMFIVLGGIYTGVVTPTEASGLGAFVALIFALTYHKFDWRIIRVCALNAVKTTSMMMLLLIGASVVTSSLIFLRVPDAVVAWTLSLSTSPIIILVCIYAMYVFLGCFMDGTSLLVLTLPLVFPIIVNLGYDPIWFGVAVVVLIEMALLTPPVGLVVYAVHGLVPDRPLGEIFRSIVPFFLIMVAFLALLTALPVLATWLPQTMR